MEMFKTVCLFLLESPSVKKQRRDEGRGWEEGVCMESMAELL